MILVEIVILLSVVLLLYILYYRKVNWRKIQYMKSIPGSPGLFLLGNTLELRSPRVILSTLGRYAKIYDGPYQVSVGPQKYVLPNDYKFLEFVLSSNKIIAKSLDYRLMHGWLGTGLLTSSGEKWRQRRKLLTPAFHFKILEHFVDLIESAGDVLVEKLIAKGPQSSLDIYPLVGLCTLDIICETALGTTINAQMEESSKFVANIKNMCKIVISNIYSLIKFFPMLYPLTVNYYKEKEALKVLHAHTTDIITARRTTLQGQDISKDDKDDENKYLGIRKKKPFLDLLLDVRVNGAPLSDTDVREEVDTFTFEGHDTTTSGISFALYCIANNPNVQGKILEEQANVLGKNSNVNYQNLQEMKYLELVIKESLRLYPSVPYFGRMTTCDVVYGDTVIPEGIELIIDAFNTHRNAKYFQDPLKFNPDRFETMDNTYPFAFIPFSAGPRNCIGQKFAMMELKSILSKIVRNFELVPAFPTHELEIEAETILTSANGVRIGIKRRV